MYRCFYKYVLFEASGVFKRTLTTHRKPIMCVYFIVNGYLIFWCNALGCLGVSYPGIYFSYFLITWNEPIKMLLAGLLPISLTQGVRDLENKSVAWGLSMGERASLIAFTLVKYECSLPYLPCVRDKLITLHWAWGIWSCSCIDHALWCLFGTRVRARTDALGLSLAYSQQGIFF